jgi:Tfp pilus assembly protein PilF
MLIALIQAALVACGTFRTEIYREETLYRYKEACQRYKQGDYDAAQDDLEKVIEMDPNYGPAHAALGNLALIVEDYKAALEHYRKAVAVNPELEADLQPLILVAGAHRQRDPLRKAGVGLDQVYPLIMSERLADLGSLLEKDVPLLLLANDTMSITPGKLGAMRGKAAEMAHPEVTPVRLRLFLGYLLFAGQNDDALAAVMIQSALPQVKGPDRQEAWVVLGQLFERQEDLDMAVDAFLAAVDAGLPMSAVAHHLARVYRVDLDSVLPVATGPAQTSPGLASMGMEIRSHIPARPDLATGSLSGPIANQAAERQGGQFAF